MRPSRPTPMPRLRAAPPPSHGGTAAVAPDDGTGAVARVRCGCAGAGPAEGSVGRYRHDGGSAGRRRAGGGVMTPTALRTPSSPRRAEPVRRVESVPSPHPEAGAPDVRLVPQPE
jgi:hypothetical protein